MSQCKGSGHICIVSDYEVMFRQTKCPWCNKKIKISVPDPKMHCNTVKFARHSVKKD